MHYFQSLNIERHHENMHEFFSIVKFMDFSLNLTLSIWHMVPHLMSISNMRAKKKNVSQFTFSIEQMFCKGKTDGVTIHRASEWKKYFWQGRKTYHMKRYGWMVGRILFFSKMQIFRELNCSRT